MDKNEIINSQKLKEDTEKEFGTKIIESNSGATRYSSRDKSYSNLIDFFVKTAKSESDQGNTDWSRLTAKEKAASVIKAIVILIVVIGFVALAANYGGRLGLTVSLVVLFAVWMIVHQIRKKSADRSSKE